MLSPALLLNVLQEGAVVAAAAEREEAVVAPTRLHQRPELVTRALWLQLGEPVAEVAAAFSRLIAPLTAPR